MVYLAHENLCRGYDRMVGFLPHLGYMISYQGGDERVLHGVNFAGTYRYAC